MESIIFLLSSLITLALLYYKVPTRTLQQIITLVLVIILVFLNRFIFARTKKTIGAAARLFLLLLASLIVQLIVLSTGGFFSPFLILLHIFTLGTSFLLNLQASISFLIFSVIILIANIYLSQDLMMLFKDDPFSFVLYLISFVVIIPLAQLLNRSYHIKDTLSRILSENLHLGQQREESILKGLNELVLVTDKDLKILSVNQALEKLVKIPTSEILQQSLLDVVPLQTKDGVKVTVQGLSLDQMSKDKAARIIKDFYLTEGTKAALIPVTIQARPITDSQGKVTQFVFVISEGHLSGVYPGAHQDLDQAHKRLDTAFEDFQNSLSKTSLPILKLRAELLKKMEEDLLTAQEIEDHSIKETTSFPDVAEMCQRAIILKGELSKSLNVSLEFVLPEEESAESSLLRLKENKVSANILPVSNFSVPTDPRWLSILLEKLLDISILLASGEKNPKVSILLTQQDKTAINVEINTTFAAISEKMKEELFIQYFGELGTGTNLRLGSGLEGFIAKTIASHLNLSLEVKFGQYPKRLAFILNLPKESMATE